MKTEVLVSKSTCIENGTNFLTTMPLTVRNVLNASKGDRIEWVVYSDKTVEVRIIKGE